jgi:hypothetical protein
VTPRLIPAWIYLSEPDSYGPLELDSTTKTGSAESDGPQPVVGIHPTEPPSSQPVPQQECGGETLLQQSLLPRMYDSLIHNKDFWRKEEELEFSAGRPTKTEWREALLEVFSNRVKKENISAYLDPGLRHFWKGKGCKKCDEIEFGTAVVVEAPGWSELFLIEYERFVRPEYVEDLARKVVLAKRRAVTPKEWRGYASLCAFDKVTAVLYAAKWSEESFGTLHAMEEFSKEHEVVVVLTYGQQMVAGSGRRKPFFLTLA